MFSFRRFGGLLVIMLLVAACGNTGATPTGSASTSNDQAGTPTLPSDTGTVVSNAPDPNATVYVETEGVPVGGFKATVQGAVEGDWEGQAMANIYPPRTGTTLTFVATAGENASYGVLIEVPPDTPPGTYTLKTYIDAFDGENIVDFGAQFSNAGTNTIDLYTTVTSGTLILSEVNPFTGRFEFTATDDENTVNVVGTFNQVEQTGGE